MHQYKEDKMTNGEALDNLLKVRENTYAILRLMYKKRSELDDDIRTAKNLIDEVEAEIRRLIEI